MRRLLRAASFEVVLQALPHLKTLRTQMRSALEHWQTFLALEAFQDQHTGRKIVDRVAFVRAGILWNRVRGTL